jgi:hypothetical protein
LGNNNRQELCWFCLFKSLSLSLSLSHCQSYIFKYRTWHFWYPARKREKNTHKRFLNAQWGDLWRG